jgi:tetratricopeptide (TPR) repeat protein
MDKTLDRAWILMGSNRFDRSEQEIRKYLSDNPDDPRAHIMLAMSLFDLSRHDDAIEFAKKAIELAPENPYSYWVLGCMYIRLQQLDPAEEYLIEAIDLNPDCPDYYASLSELYWMRGRSEKIANEQEQDFLQRGIEAARTSLEIDPNHCNARLYLIRILLALRDDIYIAEAIQLAEQLLSLSPESADAHEIYAQALICESWKTRNNEQNLNRILSILEESLRLDPNRPYAKILASNLLERYYSILWVEANWIFILLKILTIAAIPLLLLTFYFYNTCGLQLYPTGISTIATLASLILIINRTQSKMKIWLNPHHRIFLQSDKVNDVFTRIFFIIIIIGFSWNILPVWLTEIVVLLLRIILVMLAIFLAFVLRHTLLPWWGSIAKIFQPFLNVMDWLDRTQNLIFENIFSWMNNCGNYLEDRIVQMLDYLPGSKKVDIRFISKWLVLILIGLASFLSLIGGGTLLVIICQILSQK